MATMTRLASNVGAAIGAAYDGTRNRLYFVEYYGSVSVIDLATGVYTVLGAGYSNPEDVVVTADGNTAYVSERSGTLLKLALPAGAPVANSLPRAPGMEVVTGMTAPQQVALDEANNVAYAIEYLQGAPARLVRIDLVAKTTSAVISDVHDGVGLLIIPPTATAAGTAYISEQVNGGQVSAVSLPLGVGTGARQGTLIQGYQAPFFLHWADASRQRIILPLRDPANRVITLDLTKNPVAESIVVDNVDFRPSSARVLPDGRLVVCTDRYVSAYSVASLATPTGLGGGGAMYWPEISPWPSSTTNPRRWYVACDMTGMYRSTDAMNGAGTWTLLDTREVQGFARLGITCDPNTAGRVLGFQRAQGVKESAGYGDDYTWATLVAPNKMPFAPVWAAAPAASSCAVPAAAVVGNQRSAAEATALAYCPDRATRVLIGTPRGILYFERGSATATWAYPKDAAQGNYVHQDRELDYQYVNPADVFRFVFVTDPATGAMVYFAATSCNIVKSVDQGATWTLADQGLPARQLGQFRPFSIPSIESPPGSGTLIPNPNYYPSRIRGFAGGPYTAPGGAYSSYLLWASVTTLDGDLDTTVTPNVLTAGGVYVFDSAVGSWKCVTDAVPVPAYDKWTGTTIPRYEALAAASIAGADVVYVSLINNVVAPNVMRGRYTNAQAGSYAAQPVAWTGVYHGKQEPGTNVSGGWLDAEAPTGLGWGFGGPGRGLAVDPNDKNVVALSNFGVVHATGNGNGAAPTWEQKYSTPVGGNWRNNGLGVTTSWHYYVHPNPARAARHFIGYTDIGLAVSTDSGDSWKLIARTDRAASAAVPWDNIYELAFEYPVNNAGQHVWAAMSNQHDIPHATQLPNKIAPKSGGILRSTDDGQSWSRVVTSGLTNGPVVSVVYGVGPTGTAALYASVWSKGVFQSTDMGTTWTAMAAFKDAGNANVASPLCYRLALDAGKLYCLVSGPGNGSGLHRYDPATASWTCLTTALASSAMVGGVTHFYPKGFALRTRGPNQIDLYICTEGHGSGNYGKAFKYDAAGGTWIDLQVPFDLTYHDSVQAFAPHFLDAMCYISSTSQGVWAAPAAAVDAATAALPAKWTEYRVLEFLGVQRLSLISDVLYITTFGAGAWRVGSGSILSAKIASFQGQTVPPIMQPGAQYAVAVRMKNVSSTTWTPGGAQPYQLGTQSPQNGNTTWGIQRVPLATTVPPGGTAEFNFTVTAPATPGSHLFQWAMLREGVEWFGDLTPPTVVTVASPLPMASFVSQRVPRRMEWGEEMLVSITLRNSGTTAWTSEGANPFLLGSQSPQDNISWGLKRVPLPVSPVVPGATAIFEFAVMPRRVGKVAFQWQMVQEGVRWFGDLTRTVDVQVVRTGPKPRKPDRKR